MPDLRTILAAAVVGVGATFGMDVWNTFLRRALGIPSLDYCLLGRWVGHMPRGTFSHAGIASASQVPGECAIGWAAHYSIGIVLASVFVLAMPGWLERPAVLPALVYGLATVALPLFVMQPALGLGLASSKAPRPWEARLKSIGTHTVFGLGLYVSALVFTRVERVLSTPG